MFHTTLIFPPIAGAFPPATPKGSGETQPLLGPACSGNASPGPVLTRPGAVRLGRWQGHIVYTLDRTGALAVVCGKLERAEQARRGLLDKLLGLLEGIGWGGRVRLTRQQKEDCLRIERVFAASRSAVPANAAEFTPDGASPPALSASTAPVQDSPTGQSQAPVPLPPVLPPPALALEAAAAIANGEPDKAEALLLQLSLDARANGAGIASLRPALTERDLAARLWSRPALRRAAMLACRDIDEWCELFGRWKLGHAPKATVPGDCCGAGQTRQQQAEARAVRDARLDRRSVSAVLEDPLTTAHLSRCLREGIRACDSAAAAATLLERIGIGIAPTDGCIPAAQRELLDQVIATARPLVRGYQDATRLAAALAAGAYGTTLDALLKGDGRQHVVQSIRDDLQVLLSITDSSPRRASPFLHHTALSLAGLAYGVPPPYGEEQIARLLRFPPLPCRPAMALLWQTPDIEEIVRTICRRAASLRPDPALEALCMSHPERQRVVELMEVLHDALHI